METHLSHRWHLMMGDLLLLCACIRFYWTANIWKSLIDKYQFAFIHYAFIEAEGHEIAAAAAVDDDNSDEKEKKRNFVSIENVMTFDILLCICHSVVVFVVVTVANAIVCECVRVSSIPFHFRIADNHQCCHCRCQLLSKEWKIGRSKQNAKENEETKFESNDIFFDPFAILRHFFFFVFYLVFYSSIVIVFCRRIFYRLFSISLVFFVSVYLCLLFLLNRNKHMHKCMKQDHERLSPTFRNESKCVAQQSNDIRFDFHFLFLWNLCLSMENWLTNKKDDIVNERWRRRRRRWRRSQFTLGKHCGAECVSDEKMRDTKAFNCGKT